MIWTLILCRGRRPPDGKGDSGDGLSSTGVSRSSAGSGRAVGRGEMVARTGAAALVLETIRASHHGLPDRRRDHEKVGFDAHCTDRDVLGRLCGEYSFHAGSLLAGGRR